MNTLSEHDLKEFEAIIKKALIPIRRRLKATDLKLKKIMGKSEVSEIKKV